MLCKRQDESIGASEEKEGQRGGPRGRGCEACHEAPDRPESGNAVRLGVAGGGREGAVGAAGRSARGVR